MGWLARVLCIVSGACTKVILNSRSNASRPRVPSLQPSRHTPPTCARDQTVDLEWFDQSKKFACCSRVGPGAQVPSTYPLTLHFNVLRMRCMTGAQTPQLYTWCAMMQSSPVGMRFGG